MVSQVYLTVAENSWSLSWRV